MSHDTTRTPGSIGRLDAVLTIVFAALGTALMAMNVYAPEPGTGDVPLVAIPAFLAVTLPMLWRSAAPLRALAVTCGALVFHTLVFGQLARCGVAFPILAFLGFAAAVRLDGRDAQLALGLALAGALVVGAGDVFGFGVVSAGVPLVLLGWAFGRVSRSRGRLAGQLRLHNEQLRRARDDRARLEVATDRARLSHDLDTLLQRRLDHLAQLAHRGPASLGDGSAGALLAEIEQTSRATLDEMREIVGVLRTEDGAAAVAPQPTLTSLHALVVRNGSDSRLTVDGDVRALPAGVELSAYRVVEQLLDALDDAPGVAVHVHFAPDVLELAVRGPARRRGELGTAVARARERVELHRGSLTTRTADGRAEVVAELPLLGVA